MSMHFRGCSCRLCGVCSFANAGIVLDNRICQATLQVAHFRPALLVHIVTGPYSPHSGRRMPSSSRPLSKATRAWSEQALRLSSS
jgi:hypothetical protein